MMIKSIKHFQHQFPLPQTATLRPYEHPPNPINKKKNKTKFTHFTYYRFEGGIIKILFINDQYFIDQGKFPFTNPQGKLLPFKEIGNIERIVVIEAVYIGHYFEDKDNQKVKIVIKKINEAKVNLDNFEVQTIDDNFETIDVGNIQRFEQFLKIQNFNPHSQQMSIRVIIDDKGNIIDYQFFERQKKLKSNKNYQLNNEQIK